MAQETKVEETGCKLQTFERNRYFYGKPMTVSDFEAEQRYLMGKHRYTNRLIHGAGVLCGLQAKMPVSFSAERPTIEVAEGAALDCCGNLIVVSRSSTAEIKGDFNPEGVNYLYIKYSECAKQPVMSASNGSSCEEVCCYNRIQETFEIIASPSPPAGESSGTSGGGGGTQAASAAGTTPVTAAARAAATTVVTPPPPVRVTETTPDPATFCRDLTESYFKEHLLTCPGCDDPHVFLAVLDMTKSAIDDEATAEHRAVVYNNPMLHELLCDHVSDFSNPHRTTAEQVSALQSVNGVGNGPGRNFVSNITLASKDRTIGITPDVNALRIDLILAGGSVKLSHLNEEVFRNLLQGSSTVTVEPNVAARKISLRTNPATKVTSVGSAQVVGTSGNYAPEDHVHNLSEGLVERRHLAEDVFGNLLQGGGIIKVTPDTAGRKIQVTADTAPADDPNKVSSVAGTKRLGSSSKFAREDHAHKLQLNGRSPDADGQLLISAGDNVTIKNGAAGNELVISATGGGGTVVTTGLFVFDNVLPQDIRISDEIPHGLNSDTVAVILAEEDFRIIGSRLGTTVPALGVIGVFGDVTAFMPTSPSLMATVDHVQRTIQLRLKDNRQTQGDVIEAGSPATPSTAPGTSPPILKEPTPAPTAAAAIAPLPAGEVIDSNIIITNPDERTYRVRWWAIPA